MTIDNVLNEAVEALRDSIKGHQIIVGWMGTQPQYVETVIVMEKRFTAYKSALFKLEALIAAVPVTLPDALGDWKGDKDDWRKLNDGEIDTCIKAATLLSKAVGK